MLPMEEIQIERSAGIGDHVSILKLQGPLTMSTLFDFQTAIRQPDLKSTIIDLGGVPYIDSAGLGMILSHWAHTQRIGVNFAIVSIPERVRVLMDMTKVTTLLPSFPTVAEAERSFSHVADSSSKASV